jgi:hypothetical protein
MDIRPCATTGNGSEMKERGRMVGLRFLYGVVFHCCLTLPVLFVRCSLFFVHCCRLIVALFCRWDDGRFLDVGCCLLEYQLLLWILLPFAYSTINREAILFLTVW